jgi:hypothetical protein
VARNSQLHEVATRWLIIILGARQRTRREGKHASAWWGNEFPLAIAQGRQPCTTSAPGLPSLLRPLRGTKLHFIAAAGE